MRVPAASNGIVAGEGGYQPSGGNIGEFLMSLAKLFGNQGAGGLANLQLGNPQMNYTTGVAGPTIDPMAGLPKMDYDIYDDLADSPHLLEAKHDVALQFKNQMKKDNYFSGPNLALTPEEIFSQQVQGQAAMDAAAALDGQGGSPKASPYDEALKTLQGIMGEGPGTAQREVSPLGSVISAIAGAANPEFAFDAGAAPGQVADSERDRKQREMDKAYERKIDVGKIGVDIAEHDERRADKEADRVRDAEHDDHTEKVQRTRDANARFYSANKPGEAARAAHDYNDAIKGMPGYVPISQEDIDKAEAGLLTDEDRKANVAVNQLRDDIERRVRDRGGKLTQSEVNGFNRERADLIALYPRAAKQLPEYKAADFRGYFPSVQAALDRVDISRKNGTANRLQKQLKPIWDRIYSVPDAKTVFGDLKRARDITRATLGNVNDPLLDGSDDELMKTAEDIVANPSRQQEVLDNSLLMAPLQRQNAQLQIDLNKIRKKYAGGNAELDKKIKNARLQQLVNKGSALDESDEKASTKYASELKQKADWFKTEIALARKGNKQALKDLAAEAGVDIPVDPLGLITWQLGFLSDMEEQAANLTALRSSIVDGMNKKTATASPEHQTSSGNIVRRG